MNHLDGFSQKEKNLFKEIFKHHDLNHNKKGIKVCDQILESHHNHGETMAMKALLLHSMGRKEEGRQLAREAEQYACKTCHIVPHVNGLIARNDKDYVRAVACYKAASLIEKTNQQVARDLSMMQAMSRDFDAFLDTRRRMLTLRTRDRQNWYGVAVGQYLTGAFGDAANTIDQLIQAEAQTKAEITPVELSHLRMFEVVCNMKAHGPEAALASLDQHRGDILDQYQATRLRLQLSCDAGAPDMVSFEQFMQLNPDDIEAHEMVVKALAESPADLASRYDDLIARYPRSHVTRFIPALYGPEGSVMTVVTALVKKSIAKRSPSLYRELARLYAVRPHVRPLVRQYAVDQLETDAPDETKVWLHVYLHHHAMADADAPTALSHAEAALGLARELFERAKEYPSVGDNDDDGLVDADVAEPHLVLYELLGTALKHNGAIREAAETLEAARRMDPNDRFMNTVAYHAWARLGDFRAADETLRAFIRDEPDICVVELQNQHFKVTTARSRTRAGELLLALRDYRDVTRMFAAMREDEFDFHHFALRKHALTEYVQLVEYETSLGAHKYARGAAMGFADIAMAIINGAEIDTTAAKAYVAEYEEIYGRQLKNESVPDANREREPDPSFLGFLDMSPAAQLAEVQTVLRAVAHTDQTQAMEAIVELRMFKPMVALKLVKRLIAAGDAVSSFMAEIVYHVAMEVLAEPPAGLSATEQRLMAMAKMQFAKVEKDVVGTAAATQLTVAECLTVAPLTAGEQRWDLLCQVSAAGTVQQCLRALELLHVAGLGGREREFVEAVRSRYPRFLV
ncbi:N-terminal acetyltransferase A, auxiliary subunit [Carpediemonas membranifera]|uniref:N-terminal acetyltransferase A, auxiliary subunit n=1 Tax=Carpediemonas membranifera TaxID=201153 RepID=A0A8J6ASS1_9EUKA|nr:N-terminal acetyltransferase A, auxiliary subunit [Carpediemonas membranifera]|eukprot:KAG9390570.1 N-terminal acetyltransferase A, auxiliary subunit [Carpediemonas membranifera]